MFPLAVKFVFDNPWRTAALLLALALVGLGFLLKVQRLKTDTAELARDRAQMQLTQIEAESAVRQSRLDTTLDELARIKRKQVAASKELAKLLAQWPEDCDQAAQSAAGILRTRGVE